MIGDLYFVHSSIRVARIEKNIDKDKIMDTIYNYFSSMPLRYLPRHYRIKQLDDRLYAIYFIASPGARPAYYFSTSSNDEETRERKFYITIGA